MQRAEPPPTEPSPGPPSDRPTRIVALDDQGDSLRLLELRLRAAGMTCVPFSDPAAALDFLRTEGADVIILDVVMPKMDGYEVCRQLKQDIRTRDIPVIFLTGNLDMADKVQALEAGAQDYLNKPVDPQELLARTRAALRVKFLQDQLKTQIELQREIHRLHQESLSDHWQKTLGQLASSLAHEINNPLAVALGSVQLLQMNRTLTGEVLERLQVIDESLQRAAQKLRNLLLIAHSSPYPEPVALSRLLEDLLDLINYDLIVHKIKLVQELDPSCTWIGSPGELARALLYLLNNSIEALGACSRPEIRLRLQRKGSQLEIRIADTGSGIPGSIRSKIFEPFFTTKGTPHHGIGLYLAGQIFETMGGCVSLLPEAGFGTTEFQVTLPGA